jgi:DNA-binding transcriptional regulator YiaG
MTDTMTPVEYRAARTTLDLSHSAAARLLGVDARTSRRWEDGTRDVLPTAARFLRFLIVRKIKPAAVHRALGEDAAIKAAA